MVCGVCVVVCVWCEGDVCVEVEVEVCVWGWCVCGVRMVCGDVCVVLNDV